MTQSSPKKCNKHSTLKLQPKLFQHFLLLSTNNKLHSLEKTTDRFRPYSSTLYYNLSQSQQYDHQQAIFLRGIWSRTLRCWHYPFQLHTTTLQHQYHIHWKNIFGLLFFFCPIPFLSQGFIHPCNITWYTRYHGLVSIKEYTWFSNDICGFRCKTY